MGLKENQPLPSVNYGLSRIQKLLESDDSVVVFDIDGVLAAYEYGTYNHNACREDEWNEYVARHDVYENARPLAVLQKYILRKGIDRVFVCSVADDNEREQKTNFVVNSYKIDRSHIYFVKDKNNKLDVLKKIHALNCPGLYPYKIIMVDDTAEVLSNIQEHSGYSTAHISSFIQ